MIPGPGFANTASHYPVIALRAGVEGRVVATCRIGQDQRPRCFRAAYAIDNPDINPSDIVALDALVISTFRLIEESKVAATAADGRPTIGRDLTMAFTWALPS